MPVLVALAAALALSVPAYAASPHSEYNSTTAYCAACHKPHQAATTRGLFAIEPTVTPVTEQMLCFKCHDGTASRTNVKNGPVNSFDGNSGHVLEHLEADDPLLDLTNNCSSCHYPHYDWQIKPRLPQATINGAAVTGANNSWCLACHNDGNDWYGPGYPGVSAPVREADGYPVEGTFPGATVYLDPARNAHASIPASTVLDPMVPVGAPPSASWEATRVVGDCLWCHSAHRGVSDYDSLVSEFRPSTADSADQVEGRYAQACFDCHGGAADWVAKGATNIKQFATAAGPRAGHRVKTGGGTLPAGAPLPCYECHNPHGSANGNVKLLSDALGGSLAPTTTTDAAYASRVREFCFTCHSTSDGAKGWDSDLNNDGVHDDGGYVTVTGRSVVGLARDAAVGDNVLRLPVANGHREGDTQSCYNCHGSSYASGGHNVHDPAGGISTGGVACYGCHGAYEEHMEFTGARRSESYHHVLGTPSKAGDYAQPVGDPYETSKTDVYCLSCHVDHDKFNNDPVFNLRDSMNAAPGAARSDYVGATGGVCLGCHTAALAKDYTNQKDDGSRYTPAVRGSDYSASRHQYDVQFGTYSGASAQFDANCVKCHNDRRTASYQTGTYTGGLHWAQTRRLLAALGATAAEYTDPYADAFCFRCHKSDDARYPGNPNSGKDWYNVADMLPRTQRVGDSTVAESIYLFAGNNTTTNRRYSVSANTWVAETANPFALTTGSFAVFTGGYFSVVRGGTAGFWMFEPYGAATMKLYNIAAVGQPATPTAFGAGGSLAYNGEFLYAARGANTTTTYRLNPWSQRAANTNEFVNAWVEADMAAAPQAFNTGGNMEWAGGDYIYAMMGNGTKTWRYRISTNSWEAATGDAAIADLPVSAADGAELCWTGGDYLYAIVGGGSPKVYRGTINASGQVTAWDDAAAADLPTGGFGAGASMDSDGERHIYAVTGGGGQGFWRYDTLLNTWTQLANTGANVGSGASVVVYLPAGHGSANADAHRVDEEIVAAEGWLGRDNRHVVCEDCHNVHAVQRGTHTLGTDDIGAANAGTWGVAYTPPTYVTGTATFTNDSATVTGQGTAWTAANGVYPGAWIQNNADKHYYQVQTVNSATQLTLTTTYKGATAANSAYTLRLGYGGPGAGMGTATFTLGSRTITGTGTSWNTTVIPVGSYIRSNDFGGWYRVVSVNSATSITINDEYRGRTWTGQYNVIRVAYTKVAGSANTKQSQICFKCHTGFAWGTGTPPRSQSSGPNAAFWRQTDVAVDFDPVNYAYHPLFQQGRNQPPVNANTNWTGAGRKTTTPNAGLDNTFVDGWGAKSLVTCTDCHDHPQPTTGPKGPHGSAFKWLLKGLDPDVTVTMPGGVRYPNRVNGTATGTPLDPNQFCLNCHRTDVYKPGALSKPSYTQPNNTTYGNLSRFNHWSSTNDDCMGSYQTDNKALGRGTFWPSGCMNCHGGDTAGAIHGTSRGVGYASGSPGTPQAAGNEMGKRFMNGSSWTGHILSDATANNIGCYTIGSQNDVSNCTQHNGGRTGNNTVYTYPWE